MQHNNLVAKVLGQLFASTHHEMFVYLHSEVGKAFSNWLTCNNLTDSNLHK